MELHFTFAPVFGLRGRVQRMDAGPGDAELVRLAQSGSREAFDEIVRRHQRPVYQLCYRFVGNHEDASDLAQDVFVRAYKSLKGFKGESALATWLYRIGVNACLNRKALKTLPLEPMPLLDPADRRAEPADALVARRERASEVRAAIAKLPPKQRATLILRTYQDLPHDEIAKILGSSVGSVKANFFHALANLKKILTGER